MQIQITENEFQLLLNESHPSFNSSFEDEYLERGKGADIHYTRRIIRLHDNAQLSMTITYNSSIESYQDWVRGGDFVINKDQEDIFDACGQLIVNVTDENEVQEKEFVEIKSSDLHRDMIDNGTIPCHKKNHEWQKLTVEDMLFIFKKTKAFMSGEDANFSELSNQYFKMALKYKINAHRLWAEIFQNTSLLKMSDKKFTERYRIQHELVLNKKTIINLSSGDIEFNEADLKKLNLTLNNLFDKNKKVKYST